MENEKNSIKKALELLKVSRATLYNYMKKLDIKPTKEGGKVYLSRQQIDDIREFRQAPSINKKDSIKQDRQEQFEKIYTEQIEKLEKNLEAEREENKKLLVQVGQWQGRAKTLEEQKQELLIQQTETIQAEIIEDEAPTPHKPPTFAQKWRYFWKG